MWKDYSVGFIRKNRASGLSALAASFIAALFLSLLCSLFFNFWSYEVEHIVINEGDWQGRITGTMPEEALSVVERIANVERAEINEALSEGQDSVIDVYFRDMRTIYRDLPVVGEKLGVGEEALTYHETLLSRYLIHDPEDAEPPLLLTFYLVILAVMCVSFVLIIHNAFAVSMNARVHQFGIFSSIGATPGQIRTCLLQEAAALCLLPILVGSLLGIALSCGIVNLTNVLANEIDGRHDAVFRYHPLIFAVTILVSILTVLVSAWLPARKVSRLTPLAAIQNQGEYILRRKKNSRILSRVFGAEGELAGNALKAQRKALRTSALTLTLSFLGFTLMLCFFTLSGISTEHTYFERYQDAWDIMATIKNTNIEDFQRIGEVADFNSSADSIIYQKAGAVCDVPEEELSEEVLQAGGLERLAGSAVEKTGDSYHVHAPVVIMDDKSFEKYLGEIGADPEAEGTVVLNQIWDSENSNFRYKQYIPFLREKQSQIRLQSAEHPEQTADLPVVAYTQKAPLLREEYENYALVQFIPLSVWKEISGDLGGAEADMYIRVKMESEAGISELKQTEAELSAIIENDYTFEMENRIQEKTDSDAMLDGYQWILGAFCVLLASIGIANVFSNTLGFLSQRKREFARYMSVGVTPAGIRKLFLIEALVIAGRPLLITLPVSAAAVGFMLTASYLDPMEFLTKAPILPILVFMAFIFGFVALAYYVGERKLMKCDLIEALKSDHLV